MLIKIVSAAFLTFACASHSLAAESLKLDMELSVNNKVVSNPTVTVLSGERAFLTQELENGKSLNIEITPVIKAGKLVTMDFKVSQLEGGNRTLLASPRVITQLGEEASIEQKSNGKSSMLLTVTPSL